MYGIYPYIWIKFMVNVGKYTSPMDSMGGTFTYICLIFYGKYRQVNVYTSPSIECVGFGR